MIGRTDLLAVVAVSIGAAAVAHLLTPSMARLAEARDWVDRPGGHKGHARPTPYLGGVAVAAAVVLAGAIGAGLLDVDLPLVAGVLAVGVLVATVGLADDLRELPVAVRLSAEVAAGVVLYVVGVRAQLAFVPAVDVAVTVLWVVGVTNALNLIDNMDGLSSGAAAVAGLGFGVIAAVNGQLEVALLAGVVVGASLAFLRHNRHPARIFLGDAGSLFLGLVLAALGMALRFDAPRSITFAVPILVLGVPLFDTALVVASRVARGRSPFVGGRDHTSHRLTRVGIPVPAAVTLIHGAGLALSWLALVLSRVDEATGFLLQAFVVAVAALVLTLLWRIPAEDVGPEAGQPTPSD